MRKTGSKRVVKKAGKIAPSVMNNGMSATERRLRRPSRAENPQTPADEAAIAAAEKTLGSVKTGTGLDLTEKVRDLLRLAREQGIGSFGK
jgi:hypothetical protein